MLNNKISYLLGVISALIIFIILLRACEKPCEPEKVPVVNTIIDTVYVDVIKQVTKKVTIYKTDTEYVKEPWMIPDTNYAKLKKQFEDLVDQYASSKIYVDSVVIDTVSKNTLLTRKYFHDYKIPIITITKEIPLPPKRELFLGAGLSFNYPTVPQSITTGLIFKDKKNHLFALQCGVNTKGIVTYNASMYWNINFKK
jgi:hypothetical protein